MNFDFLGGLGVGAAALYLIKKFFPILLKRHLDKKSEKLKNVVARCTNNIELVHKLIKSSAIIYCNDYDRYKSIELKAEFHEFSMRINQLNTELKSVDRSDLHLDNSFLIRFRQCVTNELFSLRSEKYNFNDPLICDIYSSGEAVIEKLQSISMALR